MTLEIDSSLKRPKSIHGARTIMFAELEKVMAYSIDTGLYLEAMGENVFGKKSSDGIKQTKGFLKRLYGFEVTNQCFVAFQYFWKICDSNERSVLALIFAINQDDLLAESLDVLRKVLLRDKASIEQFEEVIERHHPNQYSPKTRLSMARNIASSWKQAGFIVGKVKNIRAQPDITFRTACFAFLLAYLKGRRGEFIWNSIGVNALCLPESKLRDLALECARKDFMQYQYAGSVTAISFTNLLNKIGINGNTN